MNNLPSMTIPLKNARHESFAQLIATGKNATQAYKKSGYTAKGHGAIANASRLLTNADVLSRVVFLRQKVIDDNRKAANKTREEKLARLEELAWDEEGKASDAISAIRAHNEMTGDNVPIKIINEDGEKRIASARERAKTMFSPLNRLDRKD